MHEESTTSTDAEILSSLDRSHNGHELDEVRAFVPGSEPTDASVALSKGPTYTTTFWRCRHCWEERTHWSGFVDRCASERASAPEIDGGFDPFDVPERVLKRAQYESFAFSWFDGDVHVRNESHADPANHEYVVRIDEGAPIACTCPADTQYDTPCKHRIAVAIRQPIVEFVVQHHPGEHYSDSGGKSTRGRSD